jgi:hypothetical protein
MSVGTLKILRIEVDGHFRGSADVPKPWVARIGGVDPKYGLARTFIDRLNDYRMARRARSGNTYGVVAAFPLHEGDLYEVSRCRGSASKRYVAREFIEIAGGKTLAIDPLDALARAEGYAGPTIKYAVPDGTRVARVDGLGTPAVCGFVIVSDDRIYRLRVGAVHEVDTGTERYLAFAGERRVDRVSQSQALAHLVAITEPQETA